MSLLNRVAALGAAAIVLASSAATPALAAQVVSPAARTAAVDTTPSTPDPSVVSRVPDPVTFLPQTPAAKRQNRPEAQLGFATRHETPAGGIPRPVVTQPALRQPVRPATSSAPPAVSSPAPVNATPAVANGVLTGTAQLAGGAGVYVLMYIETLDGGNAAASFTSYSGTFWFSLPAGTYRIHFWDTNSTVVSGYWCSGAHLCSDAASATPVNVVGGATTTVNATLDPMPSVTGTAYAYDGSPLSGAVVQVYGAGYTTTAGDGTFTVPTPLGDHTIAVQPGQNKAGGWYASGQAGHWTQLQANATPVTVGLAGIAGLTITLPQPRTISGTVTGGGNPLASSWVELMEGDHNVTYVQTGSDGTFSFDVPNGASYTLHVPSGCPFAPAWYASGPAGYAETQGAATVVSANGGNVTGLVTKLPPCPTISGKITDHTGAPLASAIVEIYITGQYCCQVYAITAADGTWSKQFVPGSYTIRASGGNEVPGWYSSGGWVLSETDATPIVITLTGRTGINIQLPAFRHITGTLTTPDGQPAAGVQVLPSWDYIGNTTGADGTYSLKVAPIPTTVTFGATGTTRPGYLGASGYVADQGSAVPVTFSGADVTGKNAVIPFWPRLSGTVTDTHGNPAAGITVGLGPSSGDWYVSMSTTAKQDGTYVLYLQQAPTGDRTVRTWESQVYTPTTVPITLTGADQPGFDLVAHTVPMVNGTIKDSIGDPVSGINVTVLQASNGYYAGSTVTGADGHYSVPLNVGTPAVIVEFTDPSVIHAGGYLGSGGFNPTTPISFTVGVDEVRYDDVVIPTYRHVSGKVLGPDGDPVAGVQVSARVAASESTWVASSTTGPDGSWSLKLIPGPWHIAVASPGGYASGWFGDGGFNYAASPAGPWSQPDADAVRDIQLPAPVTISGRVRYGTTPIDNAEVDVFLNGEGYAYTYTESDGSWSIAVTPGAYTVGVYPIAVYAHGFVGASGFTLNPAAAKVYQVGTSSVSGINIGLVRSFALSGKVTNTAGKSAPYVYVEVWVNGVYYGHKWTSSTGVYSMYVPAGTARVWMYDAYLHLAPGWRTSTGLTANPALAAATKVTKSVSGINLKAPAPRFISGVTSWLDDAATKRTWKGAFVGAYAYGALASEAISGTGGKYKMPVLPGTYAVWSDTLGQSDVSGAPLAGGWYRSGKVVSAVYAQATKVTPPSGGSTVNVQLSYPDHITGTITGPAGDPIGSVAVIFAGGTAYDAVATDATGHFSVSVPPGTYRVGAYQPFGFYEEGWYGPSGYTAVYGAAQDITFAVAGNNTSVVFSLPLAPPPAAPTGVSAAPYHASAVVSWSSAVTTAARPILHSTVTAHPGGRSCTSTSTVCTVTGLDDGTPYTFTVTATTMVGTSAASAPSSPVTPLGVPDAPAKPTVTPSGTTPTVH